jgi:hypothetical protein
MKSGVWVYESNKAWPQVVQHTAADTHTRVQTQDANNTCTHALAHTIII